MENKESDAKPGEAKLLLAILISITAIGPASTQLLLPALPVIQTDLGATAGVTQLALSAAFFALAFSELGYGPWSDRSGRKPVVIAGLALYFVGNLICLFAPDIYVLIFGRVLQACGGGVGLVLSRAIAMDVYGPKRAATVVSLTTAAMALAPLLAPTIGGALSDYVGWRSIFTFQLVVGAIVIAAVYFKMAETNTNRQANMNMSSMFSWFGRMMKDREFAAYALNATFTMGVFFSFIAAVPYVTQRIMDRPATEFGLWFMIVAAGYVAGNLVSAKISRKVGPRRMVVSGSLLSIASITCMFLALMFGDWAPWAVFIPGGMTSFAAGVSLPSAQVTAIARFSDVSGTASALIGFMIMLGGAIMSQAVGLMQDGTPYPMVIAMGIMSLLALSMLILKQADSEDL